MTRLFRTPNPGISGYAGMAMFFIAYLAVICVTFAPEGTFTNKSGAFITSSNATQ